MIERKECFRVTDNLLNIASRWKEDSTRQFEVAVLMALRILIHAAVGNIERKEQL